MVTTTNCYNVGTALPDEAAKLLRTKSHIRYRPRKTKHKNGWWIINTTLFETRDCTCGTHLNIYLPFHMLFPPTLVKSIACSQSLLWSMLSLLPSQDSPLHSLLRSEHLLKIDMRLLTQVTLREILCRMGIARYIYSPIIADKWCKLVRMNIVLVIRACHLSVTTSDLSQ
jgi:hypothetical protein